MKKYVCLITALTVLFVVQTTHAQVPLTGYFIARSACPAYQSFRRQTNPGDVTTRIDQAYDILAKNKPSASHYLIKMDAQPERRWVATSCGEHVIPVDSFIPGPGPVTPVQPVPPVTPGNNRYILAVSWQPGFCELHASKPECAGQTEDRFDASHFTLHGLWPQPPNTMYCYVGPDQVANDKNKKWAALPEPILSETTRIELNKVMPGTQSFLERHEWIKHGTCYQGESADKYFQDALNLMNTLNQPDSVVRKLFAENIGREITSSQIGDAFDELFGDGTSDKIKITCKRDGNRKLITEITIGLQGDLDEISMSDAIFAAPNANNKGCSRGIVDPVGLQ